jgi:hypothetical protein
METFALIEQNFLKGQGKILVFGLHLSRNGLLGGIDLRKTLSVFVQ